MDFDTVISKLYALANAETVSFKERNLELKRRTPWVFFMLI